MLERKSENPTEEKLLRFFNKTVDSMYCPITLQIFYSPVAANCGDLFERSAIEQIIEENDTPICPCCREYLTHVTPINWAKSIIEDALECDPSLQNERFFSVKHLADILKNQDISHNVLELEKICTILKSSNHLNAISTEKHFYGVTALALLTRYEVGILKLQKDDVLRFNINLQGLNAKDDRTGESALFYLSHTLAGRNLLLNDPRLCTLIDINTLMHVIEMGKNKGKSAYKCLAKTRDGKIMLNSPELQIKISAWKKAHKRKHLWPECFKIGKKNAPEVTPSSLPLSSAFSSGSSPASAGIFSQSSQAEPPDEKKNESNKSCMLM